MHSGTGRLLTPGQCYTGGSRFTSCVQDQQEGSLCVKTPQDGPGTPVNQRSVCPWTYDVTRDRNRYPERLTEARCCNATCQLTSGSAGSSQCEQVTYNVPVLYTTSKADETGTCVYDLRFEQMAVGCSCAVKPEWHCLTPGKWNTLTV